MMVDPPFEALVAIPGSGIATLKDLEGKKIAVYPGLTAKAAVQDYLRGQGVDVRAIEFVTMPPPEHLPALQRGDVQASHSYEPFLRRSLANGQARQLSSSIYASIIEPAAIGASVYSARFRDSNPEAYAAYLAAWDEAIDFIEAPETEGAARAILAEELSLDPQVAKACTWVRATRTSEFDAATLRANIEAFSKLGTIPEGSVPEQLYSLPTARK